MGTALDRASATIEVGSGSLLTVETPFPSRSARELVSLRVIKMAERFAGNSTAAAVAIIAAQVFLVRKWSSILVICIWIFIVFSCVEINRCVGCTR